MLYTYHIDKDERGEFSASVRDSKDQTVFEVNSEIFEDGFMSHKNDIEGLSKCLNDLGVINAPIAATTRTSISPKL